ncbi:MAG: alpha-amylase family glycosyl hydrolase [Paracoccaceae bacterium]
MQFWLDRGVDGFRLDTVNYYFHDKLLRDNPADFRVKSAPPWNPYDMQYHLFSKNQPENSTSSHGCGRCSTGTTRAPWSARSASTTTRSS